MLDKLKPKIRLIPIVGESRPDLRVRIPSVLMNASSAGQPENIKRVETELKAKQMVDIIPFLKAFLTRVLGELRGKGPGDKELHEESDQIFDQMLRDAVSFCNEKTNPRTTQLKENIDA